MKDKRFVVYWEIGDNIHHYFHTYDEARKYCMTNSVGHTRIAYLMAYTSLQFNELNNDEFCKQDIPEKI